MDLILSDEQRQLVATVRQYVDRKFDRTLQGEVTNGNRSSHETLTQLAALGLTSLAVPEEAGGDGGSLIDLALAVEELGRGGVTSPVIASTSLVALPLIAAGEATNRSELISSLANGSSIGTMGLLPPGVRNEWSIRGTSGTREGTEWLLSGAFNLVPYGHEADVLMVDAELEGRGRSLVILRLPDEGVSTRRQRVIGGEPRAAVHLDGARISESRVLAVEPSDVARSVDRAIDTAIVLQCAHTVGACEAALELSVTWAKDRSQFGRPIGSFQSVSNRCADMRSGIDAARLLTWEAAWALGRDRPDASELVSVAKHYLNQVGDLVERNAHQVHGAIGYSTEYPLHVFTRLIKAFQASYGTSSVHLERVAEAIGL